MSFTLWFTGLSGAGKTTLSSAVYFELRCRGLRVEMLDGDLVRRNISWGLGFSREDRNANIRRIGLISHLLNRNGVASIVAAISPYAESRDANRALIERYVEVYCDCPLETCEKRDPKGLYARARRGDIAGFTGVSDPYFPPEHPELTIPTNLLPEATCVTNILDYLQARSLVAPDRCVAPEQVAQEEEAANARLINLGFLKS